MDAIYGEIERAKKAGAVRVVGRHFCTHLYGPGGAVFDVMRRAFAETRERATHSVMTLTVSANSPSLAQQPHPERSEGSTVKFVDPSASPQDEA